MPASDDAAHPPDHDRGQPFPAPTRHNSEQLDREAAALRANLRRRKQQIQAREAARQAPAAGAASPHDPAAPDDGAPET